MAPRHRAIVAVIVAILTWSYSDILTWQRIFEAHGLWRYDGAYQSGHAVVLVGLVILGAATIMPSWRWSVWFAGTTVLLAYGGLVDVLYYMLDGRGIPQRLPWLDGHPLLPSHVQGLQLIWSAIAWTVVAMATWLCVRGMDAPRAKPS